MITEKDFLEFLNKYNISIFYKSETYIRSDVIIFNNKNIYFIYYPNRDCITVCVNNEQYTTYSIDWIIKKDLNILNNYNRSNKLKTILNDNV